MSPQVKGWCPGALRPMASGDGLVVRLRAPGGRLTQAQAAGIADLAAGQGSGLLDLTSRANLQLRGVSEATLAAVQQGLDALGLLDPDPATEARRNILVTPFADAETDALAADLAALLAASNLPLPGKFGFALDDGATLGAASADIRLERRPSGWTLRPEGIAGGTATETPAQDALALAAWFLAAGGAPQGRGRMAALIAKGILPPSFVHKYPRGGAEGAGADSPPATPQPGLHPQGALIGAAFGQLAAPQLRALAALGPLRLTPWRMVLVEGATTLPQIDGLLTAPDPRLNAHACTGAPGCPQGQGATRALAAELAARLPGLHVSGCAKGCAHPGAAPFTLVARRGGLYDLIRDGTAADPPALTGLDPETLRDAAFL